ncbi:MAG: hypothetical protein A4E27_00190 [Methanobacterium sp. PtaU1.Bin242]|nr:MAG: hypothetical protein A4E27_00190 [Methanobacterium sp. PtaU1.Bin242]
MYLMNFFKNYSIFELVLTLYDKKFIYIVIPITLIVTLISYILEDNKQCIR